MAKLKFKAQNPGDAFNVAGQNVVADENGFFEMEDGTSEDVIPLLRSLGAIHYTDDVQTAEQADAEIAAKAKADADEKAAAEEQAAIDAASKEAADKLAEDEAAAAEKAKADAENA